MSNAQTAIKQPKSVPLLHFNEQICQKASVQNFSSENYNRPDPGKESQK
jgi:hypothetical protein